MRMTLYFRGGQSILNHRLACWSASEVVQEADVSIYFILDTWYGCSTSAVSWISRGFPVKEGVRQGCFLSPLLYSVLVNGLLDQLSASGLGISIDLLWCPHVH